MAFTRLSHIQYTKCPFCDALLEKLQNIPCTIVHQMTKLFLVAYSARNTVKVRKLTPSISPGDCILQEQRNFLSIEHLLLFSARPEMGKCAMIKTYTKPRLEEQEYDSFGNSLCVSSLLRSFIEKKFLCHFAHSNGEANPTTAYAITLVAVLPHLDFL